jgi:hypothetical protein
MITPMIAAYLLKPHGHAEHGGGAMMTAISRCCCGRSIRARPGLRQDDGCAGGWAGVRFGAAAGPPRVDDRHCGGRWADGGRGDDPQRDVPDENSDFTQLRVEMVPGTTIPQTEAMADVSRAFVGQRPEVDQLEEVQERAPICSSR